MADSYHIIDGKVVPYSGGRKCNDTDAWRDATPLELQLQEQLEEYERTTAAQEAEIEALRAEVGETKEVAVRAMRQRDAQYNRAERLAEALRELRDLMLGQVKWRPCDCGCPQQRTPDGPHSVTWLRAAQQVEIAIGKAEAEDRRGE